MHLSQLLSIKFSNNFFLLCPPSTSYPSCLQATLASLVLEESSHTVPQTKFIQISRLPSLAEPPFTNLKDPSSQLTIKVPEVDK